jgi:hypothetical protein
MIEVLSNTTKITHGIPWDYETPRSFEAYDFEKIDYPGWKHFMAVNWKLPIYISAVYVIVIFSIQSYMKNRQPLKLKTPLFLWNLSLGIFSILGFIRIAQELFHVLTSPNGFHRSLCVRDGMNEPMAYWSILFALSKYVELGDTIFIVLRKQPLILLQWYHHCTAMTLAWIVVPYAEPITRYYGGMNYGVHSIMYPYFALKSLKVPIPRTISKCITFLQLLQMIVAVSVNAYTEVVLGSGNSCARDSTSIKWSWAIYGSYVFLFAHFFYKSYYSKKSKKL